MTKKERTQAIGTSVAIAILSFLSAITPGIAGIVLGIIALVATFYLAANMQQADNRRRTSYEQMR